MSLRASVRTVVFTGERGKVLIVDDEEDVRKSTEMLVQMLGYEAIATDDPAQVMEIAVQEKPQLILQDLKMKDLNLSGYVASLRSNPETANIPLVFFSGRSDLQSIADKYGAWGYLAKPFTEQELGRVLENAMGASEAPASRAEAAKEIEAVFNDFWNLLAALASYTKVLARRDDLPSELKGAVDGIDESLLKLEAKTERLRAFLRSVVG